jgi:hypothetical protein
MLKYLQCEKILERQDPTLNSKESIPNMFKAFENIKSDIEQIKNRPLNIMFLRIAMNLNTKQSPKMT